MLKILLFVLCSISIFANGRPLEEDKKILNLSLNYNFEEADRLIAEKLSVSDNLKNQFIYLNVELIKVIKKTDEADFKNRREIKDSLNKVLIEYAEKVVEKYEDQELSTYDNFYLGSIHGILGRLYGVTRSMTSAFSSGKEGKSIMEDIIEDDPTIIDAYLLPGMLNYYADRLGGVTEFLAGLLGLSGDRNIGLEYLEKVEREGEFNNWQATMILIELYSRMEGNKFQALPLLKKITERFPNNIHFLNWYCYDLISLNKMNELEKIISSKGDKVNDFIKAVFYHNKGEFEKSNEIFYTTLTNETLPFQWLYENAKYVSAINYYLLGDTTKAEGLKSKLNEEFKENLKIAFSNKLLNMDLFNFKKSVLFKENINSKVDIDSSENSIIQSFKYFYEGVRLFNDGQIKESAPFFLKAKELNFKDYGYQSIRYLIHIYKIIDVPIEDVEKLLDEIDDLDNDGLEFFAMDIEEKYDI